MRKQLLKRLNDDRKNGATIMGLARQIGLSYTTMHRILHGQSGNIGNWEKIDRHYRKGSKDSA
jgi:hypothetical protein